MADSKFRDKRESLDAFKSIEFEEQIIAELIQFLTSKDLVSVEPIGGEFTTANNSTCWKQLPLYLPQHINYNELETVLQYVPDLHTIQSQKPQYHSEVLLPLLKRNVKDLRVLDIIFVPPLSPKELQHLMDAYPNLESLSIHANDPHLGELLEILSHYRVKEVKFYTSEEPVELDKVVMICSILASNFPSLRIIDIQLLQIQDSDDSIFTLLSQKLHYLEFLKLKIDESTRADMLSMIFNCPTLKQLSLTLTNGSPVQLDLRKMESLKSLYLSCEKHVNRSMMNQLELPGNVEKLTVRFYNPSNKIYSTGITEKVISNLRELKYLELLYLPDEEIRLQGLENLHQLQTLVIFGPRHLSQGSMKSMAKCPNLKHFAISGVELPSEMYDCLKACMSLKSLAFCSSVINLKKTLKVANKLEGFGKLYLLHCFHSSVGYPARKKIDKQVFAEFLKKMNKQPNTTVIAKRDLPLCLKSSYMQNRKVEDYIFANFRIIDFCYS